jgi:hypothetical protein
MWGKQGRRYLAYWVSLAKAEVIFAIERQRAD